MMRFRLGSTIILTKIASTQSEFHKLQGVFFEGDGSFRFSAGLVTIP